jgi:hypothetical protein
MADDSDGGAQVAAREEIDLKVASRTQGSQATTDLPNEAPRSTRGAPRSSGEQTKTSIGPSGPRSDHEGTSPACTPPSTRRPGPAAPRTRQRASPSSTAAPSKHGTRCQDGAGAASLRVNERASPLGRPRCPLGRAAGARPPRRSRPLSSAIAVVPARPDGALADRPERPPDPGRPRRPLPDANEHHVGQFRDARLTAASRAATITWVQATRSHSRT